MRCCNSLLCLIAQLQCCQFFEIAVLVSCVIDSQSLTYIQCSCVWQIGCVGILQTNSLTANCILFDSVTSTKLFLIRLL